MRSVVLVFASLALLAQAPAPANSNQPASSWASIWAKVPEPLKTALANSPLVFNGGPPMEILAKPVPTRAPSGEEASPGTGGTEAAPTASPQPKGQLLEPKDLFAGKSLEVYSRMQAKTLGEGLVSPWGASLTFNKLVPGHQLLRMGLVERYDGGTLYFADPKGNKWPLRFYVAGPTPTSPDWTTESALSEETQKLQGFILAGEWPKAFDAKLRKAARKTSPNEPLLLALDILTALDQPAGKEAQLQEAAARLAALMPRNHQALSLSAAAYLAAGKPEFASRLKSWLSWVKPATP